MRSIHSKNRLTRLSIILLLGGSLSAFGDIYQWQDAKGREHYTDRSQENSKKLLIKPGYSYFTVDKVFDGDTVRLDDGRKVRLLGINTPEITHRNQYAEVGGEDAKQWLSNKLQNKKVRLVTDVEPFDKYRRTLAYLITENNEPINVQLVERGLAAVNIYPPNLAYVNELVEAGKRAEQAKRGIWQQEAYSVVPVGLLDKKGHAGWIRLAGTVRLIRSSRKFVYLEFTDKFQARIEKKWLSLFPEIETYRGKTLEVRGWLNKNRGGWSMLIRHPSAIKEP
ncbi:MAG: thermonuclease family protein [Methylococcaceae bacterium]|nr:thermonuclease family protein [Methylococcaceae bacterium]